MAELRTHAQLRAIIPEPSARAFAKIRPGLCDQGLDFVRRSPFLVLATMGAWGLELSPKGDAPGFVEIVDRQTLLIPERKGNQFALSLGNILADPRVGLMMIRPATDEVLRLSGRATLIDDADVRTRLATRGQPALLRSASRSTAPPSTASAPRAAPGCGIPRHGTRRLPSRSAASTPRRCIVPRSRRISTAWSRSATLRSDPGTRPHVVD